MYISQYIFLVELKLCFLCNKKRANINNNNNNNSNNNDNNNNNNNNNNKILRPIKR